MRLLQIVVMAAVLWGCTRTNVSDFTDPDYRNADPATSLIVFATNFTTEDRLAIETAVTDALTPRGVRVVRGIDLFPPTRQVSEEGIVTRVRELGVSRALLISLGQRGSTSTYVPRTYVPGAIHGTSTTLGNTTNYNFYQSPGTTYGGYTIKKPNASFRGQLIDLHAGRTVWQADANSQGNAFSSYSDLSVSAAKELSGQLVKAGHF